jgi:hypothetical protein
MGRILIYTLLKRLLDEPKKLEARVAKYDTFGGPDCIYLLGGPLIIST